MDKDSSNYYLLPLPASLRADFVEEFGWDSLVAEMGGEKQGMRDAFHAIEFAAPKGTAGTSFTLRLHRALITVMLSMLEIRWADHFSGQTELEAPYDRLVSRVRELRDKSRRR